MAAPRLALLSTTLGGVSGTVGTLNLHRLHELGELAREIIVVSAFYDVDFLRNLAAAVPAAKRRKVKLRVILHGFAGSRLEGDLQTLRELRTKWRRAFGSADIYLITRAGLFHSKLIVFSAAGTTTSLIGSANATTHA